MQFYDFVTFMQVASQIYLVHYQLELRKLQGLEFWKLGVTYLTYSLPHSVEQWELWMQAPLLWCQENYRRKALSLLHDSGYKSADQDEAEHSPCVELHL
jgi:hypothetical protein